VPQPRTAIAADEMTFGFSTAAGCGRWEIAGHLVGYQAVAI
jgi:hypothetical protein